MRGLEPSGTHEADQSATREVNFQRLTLFDTYRLTWERPGSGEEYLRLVTQLVDPSLPGRCWIRLDFEADDETPRWVVGRSVGATLAKLSIALDDVSDSRDPAEAALSRLHRCGCQLFLDSRRYAGILQRLDHDLAGVHAFLEQSPCYVGIRFEFGDVHDQLYLYPVISAWTHWPRSRTLSPHPELETEETAKDGWSARDAAVLLDEHYLPNIATPFALVLEKYITTRGPSLPVNGKETLPPTFHLLLPAKNTPDDGNGYFTAPWLSGTRSLIEDILRVPDPSDHQRMAASTFSGRLLVIYRQFEGPQTLLSNFLLLPVGDVDVTVVEELAAYLVARLQYVDHQLANRLWDITTDVEMVVDRFGDYGAVADGAVNVLDPLLIGLLSTDAVRVEQVQAAVELARRTLLQTEPELVALRAEIERSEIRIADTQVAIAGHLADRARSESRVSSFKSVSTSLISSEYFDQAKRAVEAARRGAQSGDRLHNLLRTASEVLAERREEGLARLSKRTYAFNFVLGFLAAATVLDVFVDIRIGTPWPWAVWTLRTLMVVVVLAAVAWFAFRRPDRHSVESGSDAVWDRVVSFKLRNDRERVVMLPEETWDHYDESQAKELAEIWTAVDAIRAELLEDVVSSAAGGRDEDHLDLLLRRVHHWCLVTLLVSERPYPLYALPLPRVTCLYHFRPGGLVSAFEFAQAMGRWWGIQGKALTEFKEWGKRRGTQLTPLELVDEIDSAVHLLEVDVHPAFARLQTERRARPVTSADDGVARLHGRSGDPPLDRLRARYAKAAGGPSVVEELLAERLEEAHRDAEA